MAPSIDTRRRSPDAEDIRAAKDAGDRLMSLGLMVDGELFVGSWIADGLAGQHGDGSDERHERAIRFHAFQGLYLFVAWLLDDWVLRPMMYGHPRFPFHHLVQAALLGMSIFMMVKAAHNEAYSLPLFGELAQRSVAED